jgi:hypothetical protein
MVAEDRTLRLAGYEIYRFGGYEFVDNQAPTAKLAEFFEVLLGRHNVPLTASPPPETG